MDVPSFEELFRLAPIVVIVVGVISLGFWAGFKSRTDHIENLTKLIEYFKDKFK